jgi:hypothetical protein
MVTQFSAALLFALCVSVVFAITQRADPRAMVRFGVYCFVLFAGGVIAASWLFYFIKH